MFLDKIGVMKKVMPVSISLYRDTFTSIYICIYVPQATVNRIIYQNRFYSMLVGFNECGKTVPLIQILIKMKMSYNMTLIVSN